ncbi:MAG: hypothetical protein KGI38_08330 [Thaumarchaeota archaeon]|nr:hypothetical protein [Nitrososphaerota archaeon]
MPTLAEASLRLPEPAYDLTNLQNLLNCSLSRLLGVKAQKSETKRSDSASPERIPSMTLWS